MCQPVLLEDKRLRNGDKSMSYILANYLNSGFDYVIFDSVVAAFPDIRENILRNIRTETYDMIGITLTCSEETLTRRRNKRGDSGEISFIGCICRHVREIMSSIPTANLPLRF